MGCPARKNSSVRKTESIFCSSLLSSTKRKYWGMYFMLLQFHVKTSCSSCLIHLRNFYKNKWQERWKEKKGCVRCRRRWNSMLLKFICVTRDWKLTWLMLTTDFNYRKVTFYNEDSFPPKNMKNNYLVDIHRNK